MPGTDSHQERTLDRRTLLAGGAGAVAAAGIAGALAGSATAHPEDPAAPVRGGRGTFDDKVLETVTGPLKGNQVEWALEHEHLFVDFLGAKDPAYQDVDWADVTGACVNSVSELRGQGINLFVEYTPMGVGRDARLIRNVARQTDMAIVCASGIYRASFVPPAFRDMGAAELAGHFVRSSHSASTAHRSGPGSSRSPSTTTGRKRLT